MQWSAAVIVKRRRKRSEPRDFTRNNWRGLEMANTITDMSKLEAWEDVEDGLKHSTPKELFRRVHAEWLNYSSCDDIEHGGETADHGCVCDIEEQRTGHMLNLLWKKLTPEERTEVDVITDMAEESMLLGVAQTGFARRQRQEEEEAHAEWAGGLLALEHFGLDPFDF
jgi:hypothetical protein